MYTRTHPYPSRMKERQLLSGSGSTKKTYHISLDVSDPDLSFKPGDSVAIFPSNDPILIDLILEKLQATGREDIYDSRSQTTLSLRDYLLRKANLHKVSFHKLFPVEKIELPLLEWLEHHKPHPVELCKILLPLLPRFYSVASSPQVFQGEIHLTVTHVSYTVNGQLQYGVGSHFLCQTAIPESTHVPIYIQPSPHFTLPAPSVPIILIGPGTGVAPFRAFLQERIATQAPGLNWLFFGERNRAHDFYYSDFWLELEAQGRLRLDLAFSRDQAEKIYVQHKLFSQKKSIWNWVQQGACIYVCGDAKQMAKDVDATLQKIVQEEINCSEEEARKYLKTLRAEKRYLLDVY